MNKLLQAVLEVLGLKSFEMKENKPNLTDEQKEKLRTTFGNDFPDTFLKSFDKHALEGEIQSKAEEVAQLKAALAEKEIAIANKDKAIAILSAEPEPTKPIAVIVGEDHSANKPFTEIKHPLFDQNKRWNKVALTGQAFDTPYSDQEGKQLEADLASLSAMIAAVKGNSPFKMASGDISFTDLSNEFGSRYLVPRSNQIFTFLEKLRTLEQVFTLRSNVQDKESIIKGFLGDSYTQAYQTGDVTNGAYAFQPQLSEMFDVMMKTKFKDLKAIERQYIGYLNTSGSDPIKLSFIEFVMQQVYMKMYNEREERRVFGTHATPTTGKSAHYLNASNGLVLAVDKYVDDFSMWQFTALKDYSESTMYDYIDSMVDSINDLVGTPVALKIYFNANHTKMFLKSYRTKWNTDPNYDGAKMTIEFSPNITLIGVPNMGKSKLMIAERGQNLIELQQFKAGEEYNIRSQILWEEANLMSYWKEGFMMFPGRKYASAATLAASNAKNTYLFCNNPVTELVADATTCNGAVNHQFQTIANTGATAITDITSAVAGMRYRIKCGSATNATTIAKANKFSTLTAAYTPTAVGDYIDVIYDPTASKFYEYARKVGGTITINTALVAPEYVASA
jgi:hypothetical protein